MQRSAAHVSARTMLPGPPKLLAPKLVATVEAQVIPRLRLAHRVPLDHAAGPVPTARDVAALARLLLTHDAAAIAGFVAALRAEGVTLGRIYLDLFGPAAALLGQFWADDVCDFATVTLGVAQLRRMVRESAPDFLRQAPARRPGRRILLSLAPGGQHLLGLDMVAEFFRRAGWEVVTAAASRPEELRGLLRREPFQILGFSVSGPSQLEALSGLIRGIRRESGNRRLGIMVGGPIVVDHPEQAALIGADATAADAQQATLQAERLLALIAQRG